MKLIAKKNDVLAIVRDNRAAHEDAYNQAVEAWQRKVKAEVDKILVRITAGEVLRVVSALPVPEIHLEDYDRAIRTLELHQGDTIELSEQDVAQFIQNEWGWRNSFATNTASYNR